MYLHPSTQEDDNHFQEVHLQPQPRPAPGKGRRKKGKATSGMNTSAKNLAQIKEEKIILDQPFFVSDLMDARMTNRFFEALFKHLIESTTQHLSKKYGLRDEALTEDIVADAIFVLLDKKGWTEGQIKEYAWGIICNKIVNYFKDKAKNEIDYNKDVNECSVAEEDVFQKKGRQQLRNDCVNAVEQLSPEEKEIIKRRYVEKKSFVTIAVELNKDDGNIRQKHHTAKDKLRRIIDK